MNSIIYLKIAAKRNPTMKRQSKEASTASADNGVAKAKSVRFTVPEEKGNEVRANGSKVKGTSTNADGGAVVKGILKNSISEAPTAHNKTALKGKVSCFPPVFLDP